MDCVWNGIQEIPMRLTDEQWRIVVSEFYSPVRRKVRSGPRESRLRAVLEGVLWVLRAGAPWQELPRGFPSPQTCNRWYVRWAADGTLERVLGLLATDVETRGGVDLRRSLSTAAFTLGDGAAAPWKPPRVPSGPQPWPQRTAQTLAAVLLLRTLGRKP
jgi:transposase